MISAWRVTLIRGNFCMPRMILPALALAAATGFGRIELHAQVRPATRRSAPVQMSPEQAFYYVMAIYGVPANVVERYGLQFDPARYRAAMADEFARERYTARVRARIDSLVQRVDYDRRFAFASTLTIGEYSGTTHSFPFRSFPELRYCLDLPAPFYRSGCAGTFLDAVAFRLGDAVNRNAFNWALSMNEREARSFVASRGRTTPGVVDRTVAFRVIYGIVKFPREPRYANSHESTLSPFIYSVEVFSDLSFAQRLGTIVSVSADSLAPRSAAEWIASLAAAQAPTRQIGTYEVVAYEQGARGATPGTLSLTDVGLDFSGDSAGAPGRTFFSAFAAREAYDRPRGDHTQPLVLGRTNYDRGGYGVTTWGWPQFVFATASDRDRYFVDMTRALADWTAKYHFLATTSINVEWRCEVNTSLVPCPQQPPLRPVEPAQGARTMSAVPPGPASEAARIPWAVDRIVPGSFSYRVLTRGTASGIYTRVIARAVEDGRDAIRLSFTIDSGSAAGTFQEVTVDAASLAPIRAASRTGSADRASTLALNFSGTHVRGRSHALVPTGPVDVAIDTTLADGTFYAGQLAFLPAALPLRDGGRWVTNFYTGTIGYSISWSVIGEDTVTVPAGRFACWKVELLQLSPNSRPNHYFVTKSAPFMLVKVGSADGFSEIQLIRYTQ